MLIAIAAEGNYVSGHFGHCENYIIYTVENNELLSKKTLPNPGHRPGFLPGYLKDFGIDVMIAGGMGETAQLMFKERNIEVIVGVRGTCDEAIKNYINSSLVSSGSICLEHQHEGSCQG